MEHNCSIFKILTAKQWEHKISEIFCDFTKLTVLEIFFIFSSLCNILFLVFLKRCESTLRSTYIRKYIILTNLYCCVFMIQLIVNYAKVTYFDSILYQLLNQCNSITHCINCSRKLKILGTRLWWTSENHLWTLFV